MVIGACYKHVRIQNTGIETIHTAAIAMPNRSTEARGLIPNSRKLERRHPIPNNRFKKDALVRLPSDRVAPVLSISAMLPAYAELYRPLTDTSETQHGSPQLLYTNRIAGCARTQLWARLGNADAIMFPSRSAI